MFLSFDSSNFLFFYRYYFLSFTLLVLEYLVSLVVGSLVCVGSKFYPFRVSSCLNVRQKSVGA